MHTSELVNDQPQNRNQNKEDHLPTELIQPIFGGKHHRGESRNSRKRFKNSVRDKIQEGVYYIHERPKRKFPGEDDPIAFTEDDYCYPYSDYPDQFITIIKMVNNDVARVFIDNGSSINLLDYGVYHALKMRDSDLKPYEHPIFGITWQ